MSVQLGRVKMVVKGEGDRMAPGAGGKEQLIRNSGQRRWSCRRSRSRLEVQIPESGRCLDNAGLYL